MSVDSETFDALLSDALKLADSGNVAAAGDALRSALEIDFRPEVAALVSDLESRVRSGRSPSPVIAELRELAGARDFFGSDLIIEDAAEPSRPFDTIALGSDVDVSRSAAPTESRPGFRDASPGASSEEGARYQGTPPPPPHRRARAADSSDDFELFGAPPSNPDPFEPEVVRVDSSDEMGMFGVPPSGAAPVEPEPFRLDADTEEVDSLAPTRSETTPSPAAEVFRRPRRTPAQREVPDADVTPNTGVETVGASSRETGRIRPVGGGDSARRLPVAELVDRARALMGRGDLASAEAIVEEALILEPGHGDALRLRADLGRRLGVLKMSALEPLDRVPRVNLDAATGADLNPRTMFVLSMIDGTLSLRDIIDLSGLPSGEAATLLTELMDVGALEFDG